MWRCCFNMSYSDIKFSIVFTTINNPWQLQKNIEIISSSKTLCYNICEIIIINHGNNAIKYPSTDDVVIKIINQKNLGGSGGFARGMFESFQNSECSFVVLSDDDALLNIKSIQNIYDEMSNSIVNKTSKILGSIIQDIDNPEKRVTGDYINFKNWSINKTTIDNTHFCGWWMAAISRQVYEELGLPLPLFIKWDDIEYGLRARKNGIESKILENVFVQHPTWDETSQRYSWQSYFWQRNKMIVALLYGKKGGQNGLLLNFATLLKLLLTKKNSGAFQIRILALSDLFNDPLELFTDLQSKIIGVKKILNHDTNKSFLAGLYQIIKIHLKLYLEWNKISQKYKRQFKNLTSKKYWNICFKNSN